MSEVNLSRRGFLKSFAALAAAAVVAPTMLVKLPPSDLERLFAMMTTGLVEDQTFFFTAPITLQFNNLVIRHCKFVFKCAGAVGPLITIDGSGLVMDSCHIDGGNSDAECGMKILPQPGDMTSTLQSAINTLYGGSDTERVLALAAGTYMVNSPILPPIK